MGLVVSATSLGHSLGHQFVLLVLGVELVIVCLYELDPVTTLLLYPVFVLGLLF